MNNMKTKLHHWIIIALAIVGIALLAFWPPAAGKDLTPSASDDGLTGSWYTEWVGDEGEVVWMQYDIDSPNYVVTASHDYFEEGTYEIVKQALDGSIVIEKTWNTPRGLQTYEFTIIKDDEAQTISFEGVTLKRIDQ